MTPACDTAKAYVLSICSVVYTTVGLGDSAGERILFKFLLLLLFAKFAAFRFEILIGEEMLASIRPCRTLTRPSRDYRA